MKSFDTISLEPINQNSIKVPKVFNQQIRDRGSKTFDTSVISSPMSPTSLVKDRHDKNKSTGINTMYFIQLSE